ncbi:FAD-dependent oxidoreductase [Prescottella agglutinans]|uniref:ferredoxin--NADP(+) reductase n=1 Tax=Prescottella agglutinans TaxID=1644129 RepID=A0ABT6M971_9NOCA|nr:FAD-dependent oxidoreductase [Prescottella agglutinans]MDH6280311.1 ferredoxin--NADP+ reductase [Prescottella agglutinans]
MAYVITQACCNDASCVDVCPVNCIHPTPDEPEFATTEMLYIDPQTCIDCGACVDECPVDAIFGDNELSEAHAVYSEINAAYFEKHPIGPDWPELAEPRSLSADLGTLRVAIVGSGPAACYAAIELTSRPRVEVDMFDRLPTPYGLVRAGVAPDHPGTKGVADVFRSALSKRSVQCHFNVEVGQHVSHDELLQHHHAVIYAVGAASDRHLGVPGEDLPGSHAATEFVAWYNGHPDYADHTFDLSGERAVIVGNGNVALDVARILVTDPDELAKTDIAQHAVEALRSSNIREVVIVGRRGPAQAAYTNPELIALGQMADVDIVVDPDEAILDSASRAWIDGPDSEPSEKLKVRQVEEFAKRTATDGRKRIVLRYLASPEEILGGERVEGIRLVRNELVADESGKLSARATDRTETLETGLVLRSIGYKGVPVADLPFDDRRGVIPNENGRVIDPESGSPIHGVYVAGWIKRGPTGVIGTNKHCSAATVDLLLSDFASGLLTQPGHDGEHLAQLIGERQPESIDFQGWQRIDKKERVLGAEDGRLRTKIVDLAAMLEAARGEAG